MIYITRHGETNWNISKKVMGRIDEPLNEKGKEQAKILGQRLYNNSIDLIICSPLLRTKQTAEIINENKNVSIIYDERIMERDFGEFEGMNITEFNFDDYWNYYKNIKYQKAENITDFFERVYSFMDEIKEKYSDKNILLVTHGGVSIPIYCYFNNIIPKNTLIDRGYNLGNCEIRLFDNQKLVTISE